MEMPILLKCKCGEEYKITYENGIRIKKIRDSETRFIDEINREYVFGEDL